MDIPVYLIAGFLDAGKTNFINGILKDGFAAEDKTLLICCEEGEEEYDPHGLFNVFTYTVEDQAELTPELLRSWKAVPPQAGHHRVQRHVDDGAPVPRWAAGKLDPVSDHLPDGRTDL